MTVDIDSRNPNLPPQPSGGPSAVLSSPRLLRRIGRWLLIGLAVLVCLAGAGMLYQATATVADQRTFTPAGRLIDIDGHRMHLHCTGAGSPTVLLESGAGAPSSVWAWVQPSVAQQTRVCSYDRSGLGWSGSGTQPRDAASIARELRELLVRAGEDGPFVLAGHSLGGQYALMFATLYKQDTVGLVLIDAQHPETMFRLPAARAIERQQERQVSLLIVLSRLGIVRMFNMAPADTRLPAESQAAMDMAKNATVLVVTLNAEIRAISTNRDQLLTANGLGSTPLRVLSATEHGTPELEAYTLGLQRELAALSTNSMHEIVTGADHASLLTDKDDAQRTIAAICNVVELARQR
jgi:pimeloyl-ACP methyl ester carboxylesterase